MVAITQHETVSLTFQTLNFKFIVMEQHKDLKLNWFTNEACYFAPTVAKSRELLVLVWKVG